jgi:formate dehydrogenase gamma subunit
MRYGTLVAVLLYGCLAIAGNPAKKAPAAQAPKLDCLSCHQDEKLAIDEGGKTKSLHVDPKHFQDSIHGSLACTDCHEDVKDFPHDPAPKKVTACKTCHADQDTAYHKGVHGQAADKGVAGVPGCTGCHGDAHQITVAGDPASPVNHANVAKTCGQCHGVKFVMESRGLSTQPFLSYEESVHGKAVANGSEKAAVCIDCHRSHDILRAGDPNAPIFKFNVPQTCGQCHADIAHVYETSVHGEALKRGNWQAAVCTDCHGIHSIKSHLDPQSTVAALALARSTCAACHEGVRLSREFGVPSQRASTYLDSYHGLASKMGSGVVANCSSCHGVHNIYKSTDPRSTINAANLAQTCGTCHPGAGQKFSQVKVHVGVEMSKDVGSMGAMWVKRIYMPMIFVVIGGMFAHNLLIWRRKIVARRQTPMRTVERMNPRQRVQHWLMLSSFILLAISGFALKYPDSPMAWLLGNEAIRRVSHRVAAIVMVAVSLWHFVYLLSTKEGRRLFLDFLPTMQDARNVKENLFFYLGWSKQEPKFGRFTYGEKAEYLALVWGTFLMTVTGFLMWFKVQAGAWFTGASVDIATAVHFYEAILAVLAIIVWHFYQVMFDPDVYPLDWTFWDGKVSLERAQHHHPLAYGEPEHEAGEDCPEGEAEPDDKMPEDKGGGKH